MDFLGDTSDHSTSSSNSCSISVKPSVPATMAMLVSEPVVVLDSEQVIILFYVLMAM